MANWLIDPLAMALLARRQREEDDRYLKLCKRLKIQYESRENFARRKLMLADIGACLAQSQPEFTQKKRGRRKSVITKPVKLALDLEDYHEVLREGGISCTDTELAKSLHRGGYFSVSTRNIEFSSLRQQISRGKKELMKLRKVIADTGLAKNSK